MPVRARLTACPASWSPIVGPGYAAPVLASLPHLYSGKVRDVYAVDSELC